MIKKHRIKLIDGEYAILTEDENVKILESKKYNFFFDKKDGFFVRFGETKEDDGDLSVGLPEIADIEIAEVCEGVPGVGPCAFCYKNNVGNRGKNMSLETFKIIFHKLPPSITQIAFGCGTLRKHPEMWDIFKYSKDHGITPNLTINGDVDGDEFDKISELCGSCAVSIYDKELSYDAIKALTDRGMKQCNIHYMISQETYEGAFEIMNDIKTDSRLKSLGAIVFLSLKPKGRSKNKYKQLTQLQFNKLIDYAFEKNISFGMDSCSTQKFMKSVENHKDVKQMNSYAEPCESTLYSMYIDVSGDFFPCSFANGAVGWETGLSVIDSEDFIKDVWQHKKTKQFRENVIECRNCKISCPIYEI